MGYTPPFYFGTDPSNTYVDDLYIACTHNLQDAAVEQGQITLATESIYVVPTVGSRTAAWLESKGYDLTLTADVERN